MARSTTSTKNVLMTMTTGKRGELEKNPLLKNFLQENKESSISSSKNIPLLPPNSL